MTRSLPFALIAVLAAGAAQAEGPTPVPVQPAPVVVAPSTAPFWEGAYVGGQIGYANGDFELDLDTFDDSSVIGGITAGYLFSLGNGWYLGPEFQYDWADMTITDPDSGNSASFDEIARLKLIVGYELGNGLLYGSAGLAYASMDGIGDFFDGSTSDYVLGVGYDWRIGTNWTVGGEYMFQRFDGIGDSGGDVDVNTIQLKATYRF